eukprot:TRINITY_DN17107_c1_g1_i3.p7 TRINITY_DN17107_c1_g1~~TRINITY_DN17107_c1_g1_i3.p7  ORF type:complete len:105 (-),score=0.50 TRINITY_DN17107_c1_g1_i3:45-359(-)
MSTSSDVRFFACNQEYFGQFFQFQAEMVNFSRQGTAENTPYVILLYIIQGFPIIFLHVHTNVGLLWLQKNYMLYMLLYYTLCKLFNFAEQTMYLGWYRFLQIYF